MCFVLGQNYLKGVLNPLKEGKVYSPKDSGQSHLMREKLCVGALEHDRAEKQTHRSVGNLGR